LNNLPKKLHIEGRFIPVPKGSKPLTKDQIKTCFKELDEKRKSQILK